MSRFSTIIAVCAGAMLVFMPVHPATAATKKGSTKKSSTTTKKKSTTDSAAKKPSADDAKTGTTAAKKGNSLDLPLPEKPTGAGESATAKDKKTPESAPSTPKPADKSADKPTTAETKPKAEHAPNATVEPDTIAEFAAQSPRIQQMIRDAVDLTRLNLTYTFGSADPDAGGMDCSGTIFYLLNAHGVKDVPRDSRGQYMWSRKSGMFFPVVSSSAESEEFNELLPGDLMFWTGTYQTGRDIPISHVMMYLGREKADGKRIMFGASDGRSYNGVQRWGVSVFDFKMPKADGNGGDKPQARFVGYARVPGLRSGLVAAETVASNAAAGDAPKTTPKPSTTSSSKKKKGKSN